MLPRSLSLARLTALSALLMGLSLGCGGSEPPTPSPTPTPRIPDATLSTVEVSHASGVWADGIVGSRITVTVRDTERWVMAGVTVTLKVEGADTTLTSSEGVTDRNGVVATYLRATSPGVKTVTVSVRGTEGTVVLAARPTVEFRVVPFLAGMVFESQPEPSPLEVRYFMKPVRVRLVRDDGKTMVTATSTVSLSLRGGTGTLLGQTTVMPNNGIATFEGLSVDTEGTGYTLVASVPELPEVVASAAFDVVDTRPPAMPVLVEGDITRTSIQVQWDAVGDDGVLGTATAYDLRYSASRIVTDEDFAAATRVTTGAPQAVGTRETATLTGLELGTTYHVAMKVMDNAGHFSRSNVLHVATRPDGVSRLDFRPQPADGVAGEPLSNVQVALLDANGNTVTEALSTVTLALVGDENLRWTAQPVNGVATFSDVRINRAGTHTLQAAIRSATETSATFTIRSAPVSTLRLALLPLPVVSGVSRRFEVIALDAFNNIATDYTGTVRFTSTDAAAVLPADTTFTPADAGRRFFDVTLNTAGRSEVTVTDGTRTASLTLDVRPGAAVSMSLSGLPAPITAGAEQAVIVTVRDAQGNIATGYSGTVGFTSSDTRAVLPGLTTFMPEDLGQKTVNVRFRTAASSVSLRVEDTGVPTLNVTATTRVVAAAPASLDLVVLEPQGPVTAGQTLVVAVTARDEFGNRAPSYTGTVRFTASSANTTLPPETTFLSTDSGRRVFSSVVLRRAGRTELTVTDTASAAMTAMVPVDVSAAAPSRLGFTVQPQSGRVRASLNEVRVGVLDAFDNVTSGSGPVVSLALSGGGAGTLGGTTTATPSSGVAAFASLSVDDEGLGYTLRATAEGLDPATSASFDIVDDVAPGRPVLTAGERTVFSLDVEWTAVGDDDGSGKAAAYELRYATTPIVTDADFAAATRVDTDLPATPGTRERVTLRNLAPATTYHVALRVTDGAGNATRSDTLTVATPDFVITRLAFTRQPRHTVAGQLLASVEVSLLDADGNVATTSSAPVTLAIGDANRAWTLTLDAVRGVASFDGLMFTRASTGNTLEATSGTLPAVTSQAFDILPAAPAGLVLSGLTSPAEAGTPQSITVTAYDAYGNVATGYRGTVRFASTDGLGAVPEAYTFTRDDAGRRGFFVALRTAGDQEVQVVDTVDAALADLQVSRVTPVAPSRFDVLGGAGPLEVGTAFPVELVARDPYGNVATGYRGTVRFLSVDARDTLPDDYTFTAEDHGRKTFTGLRLVRAGIQELAAIDRALMGPAGYLLLDLIPGPAVSLRVFPREATVTAGQQLHGAVALYDRYGNLATDYQGTVRFSSPETRATLPADATFIPADMGQRFFEATFLTAGSTSLDVVDLADAALADRAHLQVAPAAPASLAFTTAPADGTVRTALAPVQVVLRDAYGNTARGSSPAVRLALAGGNPSATLLGQTLVSPVDGVATFSNVSVDQEGTGFQLVATAGALSGVNSASFSIVDDRAPGLPVISAGTPTTTSITLSWSAVGDDGLEGVAASYEVRYSEQPITNAADWAGATFVGALAPQPVGSSMSLTASGLASSTRYYFGLEVRDGAGNAVLALAEATTVDPCEGFVCEPQAATCTADARAVVTYTAACRDSGGAPVCENTPAATTRCAAGTACSAGACVPVTADQQAGNVVITELRVLGGELIELHNATGADLDVRGFTFENAAGTLVAIRATTDLDGSAGTAVVVPAGGYLHGVANPADGVVPAGVGFVYGAPGTDFALADTGDVLVLSGRDGVIEDAVDFRSFVTDPSQPLTATSFVGFAGSTTQLDGNLIDAGENDSPRNWCVSFYPATGTKQRVSDTAGAANGSCGVAVLNEVLIDLVGDDNGKAFIEIAGPGGALVGGLQITDVEGSSSPPGVLNTDGDRATGETDGIIVIPEGTRIPADGILIIADETSGATNVPNFVPGVDVLAYDADIENAGGDSIQLIASNGVLLDALGTDLAGNPLATNTAFNSLAMYETGTALYPSRNSSLARSTLSLDTDDNRGDFRGDPTPTPGLPNDTVTTTVTSISPNNGLASTSTSGVIITGTDLAYDSHVFFGATSSRANCAVELEGTRLVCTAPGNGGVPAAVDVIVRAGPAVQAPQVTVPRGFTYTGTLNETNTGAEADYCNLQWPPSITVGSGQRTGDIYAQLYEAGVTEAAGPGAGVRAELGFGPVNANPTTASTWRFFPATFNAQSGNNDEFSATLLAPVVTVPTQFSYTARFSRDDGLNWTYCDLNGAGSNGGLTFEATELGLLTVNP